MTFPEQGRVERKPGPETLLLDGGLVITMDPARRMIRDGAVLIEGESILAVGKASLIKSCREWTERIDTGGKIILPGFIDTHVHLSEHIVRSLIPDDDPGWMPRWLLPIYASLSPEDEYHASMLAFIEMIKTGTTTFCEAGTCLHVDHAAEALRLSGMRGILGRWTWDIPRGPERLRQNTAEALSAMEEMLGYVRSLNVDRIQAWPLLLGMGTASEDLFVETKRLAEDFGTGFGFMHASNIPTMETLNTIQPLRRFEELGILGRNLKLTHMVYLEEGDIDLLARYGVKITHCPTAAMKHSKGISWHGKFPEMAAEGVCVSLGADSANSSDHADMLRLMHVTAHIYKDFRMSQEVFPAETVLEMATLRGAEALLMENQVGSIEEGKKADLVLFDQDHPEWRPLINPVNNLVYAVTDRSIDSVFVSGRRILHKGVLAGIDEGEVYQKVDRLSRRVMERAGIEPVVKWPLA